MLLQQLYYFHELTKHQSISAAATSLNMNQSTLSQAIINLESELDLILFTRSNKGVSLTPNGYNVLKHSKIILEKSNEIKKISQGELTYFLNLCNYLFLVNSHLLHRFHSIYDQQITLTVLELLKSDILVQVANMQSEIGFLQLTTKSKPTILKLADTLNLELSILHTDKWHVNTRPNHRLTRKYQISSQDLLAYPIIFTPTPTSDPLPLKNFTIDELSLFNFSSVIYLNNSHNIINFLHHSDAFFLSPSCAASQFEDAGLISQPLHQSMDLVEIALVKIKDIPLSPEATVFVQLFKEQFNRG